MKNKIFYPLVSKNLTKSDILEGIKTLKTGNITMGEKTTDIEKQFQKQITKRYSVMVNSGSSANLLIFQCLINPKISLLKPGDEVLIPAICWSTSLWPIIQSGLKPVFVDVDEKTLNICEEDFIKKIRKRTKALMLVHVLGNCANMHKIKSICIKKKIILIEDSCEALGSKYKGKNLGTFGDFSSFSMYYSHHITSGEGGFVSVKNKKFLDIIKLLRSHGWSRALGTVKNRWEFVNSGFNLRPLDISASIGINQLKRLKNIIKIRNYNFNLIRKFLINHKKYKKQFSIINSNSGANVCWFGMAIKLNNSLTYKKMQIQKKLREFGVETRPIISGNFARQTGAKLYKIKSLNLKKADKIDNSSFFIGIHNLKIKSNTAKKIADSLFKSF